MHVVDGSGRVLGCVHELRSRGAPEHGRAHASRRVTELVYGRQGWLERFGLRGAVLEVVPWKAVRAIEGDRIVVDTSRGGRDA